MAKTDNFKFNLVLIGDTNVGKSQLSYIDSWKVLSLIVPLQQ